DGVDCLARQSGAVFGNPAIGSHTGELGIVVSSDWDRTSDDGWEIGKDKASKGSSRSTRYLLETLVEHKQRHWRLRFYTTHLSHNGKTLLGLVDDNQKEQRIAQTKKLLDIVRERAQAGE